MKPWIETYTGVKFWSLNSKPEDVNIEDIAHGLSNKCRFNGQCFLPADLSFLEITLEN